MKSKTQNIWYLLSTIILGAGLVWIWISRVDTAQNITRDYQIARQGFKAPDFSLSTLSGEEYTLSELMGGPVLVNIWATWCPPCRAEMPALEQVYQDYQSEGFIILGVNATSQDSVESVNSFIQEYDLSFPILLDTTGDVESIYQSGALPTSYFIDGFGIIQDIVIGGPMSEALLRIRVEELLNISK